MKFASTPATITLTPENSKGVTKLAALIGWTPDKIANHLLAETLEMFANKNSGALEGFLGTIYYPDRESAQRALDRVTQMTRASFGGRLPDSFRAEIFERVGGTFDSRVKYAGPRGANSSDLLKLTEGSLFRVPSLESIPVMVTLSSESSEPIASNEH